MAKSKSFSFEEKMKNLNNIVEKLSDSSTSLDESIKLYEEGLKLTDELQTTLKAYQDKIKKINDHD